MTRLHPGHLAEVASHDGSSRLPRDMARVRRKIGRVNSLNATIEAINAAVAAEILR